MTNSGADHMNQFLAEVEQTIARWHGISAPNEPARRMAADLIETIRAFEKLRGTLVFEDEPASFEAALLEAREE
ncbi:MAG: hypothetical protein JO227_03980 [Acetobacteraceae bacterium]|nr:hypothetical protein [Acetobacteraceae bacterium]